MLYIDLTLPSRVNFIPISVSFAVTCSFALLRKRAGLYFFIPTVWASTMGWRFSWV